MLSGRIAAHALQIEQFYDIQLLQKDMAARIGRHLVDLVAAVVDMDRFGPVGVVVAKVLFCEKAIAGTAEFGDCSGNLALVEGLSPILRDLAQSPAEVAIAEQSAGGDRGAIVCVNRPCVWVFRKTLVFPTQAIRQLIADGKAVFTERNGRPEDLL